MKKVSKDRLHRQRNKDDFEVLRGKNRELVKEIKRLRRLKGRMPEQDVDEWDVSPSFDDAKDGILKTPCPKCGSYDTHLFEAAHKTYLFCQNAECDYRGPLK